MQPSKFNKHPPRKPPPTRPSEMDEELEAAKYWGEFLVFVVILGLIALYTAVVVSLT